MENSALLSKSRMIFKMSVCSSWKSLSNAGGAAFTSTHVQRVYEAKNNRISNPDFSFAQIHIVSHSDDTAKNIPFMKIRLGRAF